MIFRIDLKILILIVLLYFTKQLKIYLITMIFVILHEVSHLVVGLILKMKVKSLSFMPLGLSVEFIKENNNSELKNILIAIAGPLFNITVLIVAFFIKTNSDLKNLIIYSNFSLAILNLLPIFPLDGGRIIRSLLNLNLDKNVVDKHMVRITEITLFFITFIFSVFIYYYKNIFLVLIVLYLWYIVLKENNAFNADMF